MGYSSQEAQKKFADSLLKIADKIFWAPMAYLGIMLYQSRQLDVFDFFYILLFFILGILMRHQALEVYDLHYEKTKKTAKNNRLKNRNNA